MTVAIVELDLRRDLPKVVEALPSLIESMASGQKWSTCQYVTPCVVGVMIPEPLRLGLDNADTKAEDSTISTLIREGFVSVPFGQAADFRALQVAFDNLDPDGLRGEIERVRAKYLTA